MKNAIVPYTACLLMVLAGIGCGVDVNEESSVSVSSQELTLAECEDQRNACFDDMGILGLAFCNLEYSLCIVTADNGLPAEVREAIEEAAQCRAELDDCLVAAETPSELVACAEAEAICIAEILDVELPPIVTGTSACVDSGIECINEAVSVSDLAACGETLAACTLEEASAVIPDEVTEVVGEVMECTAALQDCIIAASTPSELTACSEQEALCVASSLGVDLPDIPVSDLVGCAETAAECTREAETVSDIAVCANGLVDCGQAVVDALAVPDLVSCSIAWTTCLLRNPFAFGMCAEELRACQED